MSAKIDAFHSRLAHEDDRVSGSDAFKMQVNPPTPQSITENVLKRLWGVLFLDQLTTTIAPHTLIGKRSGGQCKTDRPDSSGGYT